jgi:4-hydroxybenzoate polyprenyltransferase
MALELPAPKTRAGLMDYIRIARFDHMTKHIFIVPGVILALLLRPSSILAVLPAVLLGFVAAVLVASANYSINEWLDRDFDRFHPEKSQRAAVQREMSGTVVLVQYIALLLIGLLVASAVNATFFWAAVLLAVSGVTYNVQPFRTKDRVYIDVLSESLNNPIRLLMGWAMVDGSSLPPASLILAFWMGGAFLMNSKRLAEYRDIVASDGLAVLERYRRSFKVYTENRLSVANLVYALSCSFFMAVFLIKYRIEYVLLFPCIVVLFAAYYSLALTPDSVARKPEMLYRSRALVLGGLLTAIAFMATTFTDIDLLNALTDQRFIELNWSREPTILGEQ